MVFSILHFLKHYYNGIFHISFFKALLINEGQTTRGKKLRHRCSGLNVYLYRVNLKDDPRCVCGHLLEDAIHFFLECPLYQHDRTSLNGPTCRANRPDTAKRQRSILSFFGNANGPTQQKTTKSYEYWMFCLSNVQSLLPWTCNVNILVSYRIRYLYKAVLAVDIFFY
jgi:hypothetical protein